MSDRDRSQASNKHFDERNVPGDERRPSREAAYQQVKPGGTVGRDVPERSQAHDTEIAIEAGRHPGRPGSGSPIGSRHDDGDEQIKPGGKVGRDVPERSQAHDTELAVETGRRDGERGNRSR